MSIEITPAELSTVASHLRAHGPVEAHEVVRLTVEDRSLYVAIRDRGVLRAERWIPRLP